MASTKPLQPQGFRQVFLEPAKFPIFFVLVMWAVQLAASEFGWRMSAWGVKPREWEGLLGIFTMPFVHGGYEHLSNNSMPMIVLGWALFKFYKEVAWRALLGIWLIGGFWLWISGRDAYHIGASGVVYGLASFLFLSGWLRKEKGVAALSLVIVFVYGSLWWGVLPVDPQMSWEGHLWGALAGFGMAWYLRKKGPQRPLYQWEMDEIEEQKRQERINAIIDDITFEEIIADGQASAAKSESLPQEPDSQSRDDHSLYSNKVVYTYKPSDKRKPEA